MIIACWCLHLKIVHKTVWFCGILRRSNQWFQNTVPVQCKTQFLKTWKTLVFDRFLGAIFTNPQMAPRAPRSVSLMAQEFGPARCVRTINTVIWKNSLVLNLKKGCFFQTSHNYLQKNSCGSLNNSFFCSDHMSFRKIRVFGRIKQIVFWIWWKQMIFKELCCSRVIQPEANFQLNVTFPLESLNDLSLHAYGPIQLPAGIFCDLWSILCSFESYFLDLLGRWGRNLQLNVTCHKKLENVSARVLRSVCLAPKQS